MFFSDFQVTDVRLEHGYSMYSGRVEVMHMGQWGTICDTNFDYYDVQVLCRMLGHTFGTQ